MLLFLIKDSDIVKIFYVADSKGVSSRSVHVILIDVTRHSTILQHLKYGLLLSKMKVEKLCIQTYNLHMIIKITF